MWLYDWEHLTLDHHFANFGGFRYCSRADKTFSICHVISCSIGCVTTLPGLAAIGLLVGKTSQIFHFMERVYGTKLLIVYNHPAKFSSHGHCGIEYLKSLVCHIIIWSCDLMGRNSSS